MSKRRKQAKWIVIFLTLALATAYIGVGIAAPGRGDSDASLVKAAGMEKAQKVIVIRPEDDGDKGLLTKFARQVENRTVCEVSQSGFAALAEAFGATTGQLDIDGNSVDVVKVARDGVKGKDILDVVIGRHTGEGKCKVVKKNNFFYMLFNANIS